MDIKHLKYFLAIANSPSLSAAAQYIGVAQPSLSQHVKRMEEELGVKLLERSPRGTVLTEEGLVLVEHAKRICADMDRCVQDMKDLSGTVRGTVSFGMPPSASMVMSVALAETVRLELPEVRLKVVEAISGYITPWLKNGTVDLGIIYDLENAEQYDVTHVLNERLYFVSAPDAWPFDTPPGDSVPFKDLAKLDMILPSNGLRKTIQKYEDQIGITLNVVIEMDAMRQIMELVARGSGYAIFAPAATHHFERRGELVRAPIIDPILTRPVHLVNHPERVLTRAGRTVKALTLQIAQEMVRRGIWEGDIV